MSRTKGAMSTKQQCVWVYIIAIAFQSPGVEREDYRMFLDRRLPLRDVVESVPNGCIPPGLVLECRGKQYTVHGEYGQHGHLLPLGRRA